MAPGSTLLPPDPHEVEVSVFGPGIGECVVVHLGHGEWMVIDSCLTRDSRRPVALEYLDALGVDVETAVRLIVVSHFHDDHIQGIAEVARAARSSDIVVSAALSQVEFFKFVAASKEALDVFKVAHHGSINGHNADVWDRMLGAAPYALVTPFAAGKTFLPSDADIARLKRLTSRGYCTAVPGGWSPRRRDSAVERTLKEVAPDRRALTGGTVGHVRLRADGSQQDPPWAVELFNGAVSLDEVK